jgi:GT2 family glycosyltransferase
MPEEIPLAEEPSLKVTVLIPSYNCLDALRRTVESVERSQARETLEILVVDKGSQDGCARIDTEYPRTTILRLPRNFGQTKALNIGTRTAQAEAILILPAGMEVAPDTVSRLAARLEATPEAIALVCAGESGAAARLGATPERLWEAWRAGASLAAPESALEDEAVPVDGFENAAVLVRKQFIRGMNFFDERYGEYGWEIELAWQIRRAGRKLLLVSGSGITAHPEGQPAYGPSARAQLEADRALGMAAYAGKHFGFGAGLLFRMKAVLVALGLALGALVRARAVGYHFSVLADLVAGQKVDGSQASL